MCQRRVRMRKWKAKCRIHLGILLQVSSFTSGESSPDSESQFNLALVAPKVTPPLNNLAQTLIKWQQYSRLYRNLFHWQEQPVNPLKILLPLNILTANELALCQKRPVFVMILQRSTLTTWSALGAVGKCYLCCSFPYRCSHQKCLPSLLGSRSCALCV